jgi:hypothetical protein
VNQVETGQQLRPDVDIDAQGNFVVVWQDSRTGDYDIRAARFTAAGARIPNEQAPDTLVNTGTDDDQREPRVAVRADGTFVVVWEDDFNNNNVFQIKAAHFPAAATQTPTLAPLVWPNQGGATDRTINQFSDGQQLKPAIAARKDTGDFVIVWEDDRNTNNVFQIKAAGFDAAGNKKLWGPIVSGGQEEDATVNQDERGQQLAPEVSMNVQGHFAVVWEDDRNDNDVFQIRATGFNFGDSLTRLGDPQNPDDEPNDQTVNFNPQGQQREPDVLLSDNDQVFVVWKDNLDGNDFQEVVAKAWVLGKRVESNALPSQSPAPLFAEMDGPPWFATQGGIEVDFRQTIGDSSIAFLPGFTEARPPAFAAGGFSAIGSKLLVDVFVPAQQPASNYKGAVQLYWGVPSAGQYHQFVGQKELSPLAGGVWHTLEFDLPDVMRGLFLAPRKDAELAFAVNTDPGAPARTLLDNLRFGGVLIPHSQSECDSADCLAVCGPGKDSCDGNPANGCETYLSTSRSHCGACGHSCGGGLCIFGVCEPAGARNISANISFTSQWSDGYCAEVTFTNQSLAPVAWEVVLDTRGSTITSSWNGTFSGAQGLVSVSGVGWNNVIQPGASLHSLGFCAQRPTGANTASVLQTNTQFQ